MESSVDNELSLPQHHQMEDFSYHYDHSRLSFPVHPELHATIQDGYHHSSIFYPLDLDQMNKHNMEMAKDNMSYHSSEGAHDGSEWQSTTSKQTNSTRRKSNRKKIDGPLLLEEDGLEAKRQKFLERNRIAGNKY